MIEENYNFSYTIDTINIEEGTFVVHYIPESEYLTPVSLNTYLIERDFTSFRDENNNLLYTSQSEVPFSEHIKNTVDLVTPIAKWRKQFMFQNNLEEILNSNGQIQGQYQEPRIDPVGQDYPI